MFLSIFPPNLKRLLYLTTRIEYPFHVVLSEVAETVSHAVADNIHYAADNISSAVASAYTVFRQKTVEMQVIYIIESFILVILGTCMPLPILESFFVCQKRLTKYSIVSLALI